MCFMKQRTKMYAMRCCNLLLLAGLVIVFFACGSNGEDKQKNDEDKIPNKEAFEKQLQPLNVFNMGGVPANDMDELMNTLQKVYPNTKYAGEMSLVDSAYIKNDNKGNNRYWWSKLLPHLRKTTDIKHGITLVIVNAEVCNWDKKSKGSHANFGISSRGGHISTVSYQRLKVNRRNNINDMMKVVIHELGHSVGGLVPNRESDGGHCPNKNCLMQNAHGGFPYDGLITFCSSCRKVMKSKGFNLDTLQLKKR